MSTDESLLLKMLLYKTV